MTSVVESQKKYQVNSASTSTKSDRLLEWNYDHSSDVIHGKVIRTYPMVYDGRGTDFTVTEIEVIEVFKGPRNKGDVMTIGGIEVHEYPVANSEHLLLLHHYDGSHFEEPERKHYFRTHLVVHNWFCALEKNDDRTDLVMYDMINSEEKGPNYHVSSKSVFDYFKKRKENSNKS